VAIIVLTIDQKKVTLRCLESLSKINYTNYQIVLVDNGSKDGTSEAVAESFPKVMILKHGTNRGAARGRNTGIRYAAKRFAFDYILIIDNDTVQEPEFLTELVVACEGDPSVGLAYPKISYLDKPSIIQYAGDLRFNFYIGRHKYRSYNQVDRGQFEEICFSMLGTGVMLIKKHIFDEIRGFDEIFDPYGFEDIDFGLRATQHGYRVLYVPRARVLHEGSRTPSKGKYNAQYAALKGRNLKIFVNRHANRLQRIVFNSLVPIHAIARALRVKIFAIKELLGRW